MASAREQGFWSKVHHFHAKRREEPKPALRELKLFRVISLLLWFACAIVDTIAYSKELKWLPAKIFLGIKAPFDDIWTILYASGSAAFGVSYEIYPLLIMTIINFILAIHNCDGRQKLIAGFWLVKTVFLMIATQLCYYNFARLGDYEKTFSQATKYMLRHALVFVVTMIFLMAPGLRAVYEGITGECSYTVAQCNVIEMYEPLFNKTDSCENGYTQYIVGREQLRILRDFLLIHIASYAIYNQSFLALEWQWYDDKFHYFCRLLLLFLFVFMTISAVIANVIPFDFPKTEIKLIFDMTELIIFLIGIMLLCLNRSCMEFKVTEKMCATPNITNFG